MKIPLDGIPHVRDGFVAGLALRNATRQHRAFRHKHAVLVRLDQDSEFHGLTLALLTAIRNAYTHAHT